MEDTHIQRDHPLVPVDNFPSIEDYVIYLIHLKAYEEAATLASGRSLLDWGCNDGYGMEMMRALGVNVSGLDTAEHCIAAARNRLPALAEKIRLYDGNAAPFPSHSFDVITAFQVIEHVSDYDQFLNGVAEALKPNGFAIFTTPNRNLRLDPGMKPWNIFHVTEFTPQQLQTLLLKYFRNVEIRGLHGKAGMDGIERARCERAKLKAKREASFLDRCRRAVRVRLLNMPEPKAQDTPQAPIERTVMDRYSTKDLYYSSEGVDQALDLMAICRP